MLWYLEEYEMNIRTCGLRPCQGMPPAEASADDQNVCEVKDVKRDHSTGRVWAQGSHSQAIAVRRILTDSYSLEYCFKLKERRPESRRRVAIELAIKVCIRQCQDVVAFP